MNRKRWMVALALGAGALGPAAAQNCPCSTTLVRVQGAAELRAFLEGRTVCAAVNADRWQERHVAGGALRDYKRGPTDKIDPTKQVGTWSTSGSGGNTVVTYNYGPSAIYSYTVCRPGPANQVPGPGVAVSPVAFCGQTNITNASLTVVNTTDVACP